MSTPRRSGSGQARAPRTESFDSNAFEPTDGTELRWLGMAGFLLTSHGTAVMIDPLLGGFDMPLMIDLPITAAQVPHLDAVLVTHSDNDHYSRSTCRDLAGVTEAFHSTEYVGSLMADQGLRARAHAIGEVVTVGPLRITVTPADHAWQNASPGAADRVFADEDACGFWIETPDGTVWAPGDSRLIRDHHLTMPAPDVMLFDFSDSDWHFGLAGAVEMADAYPDTILLPYHWGSVDAPEFPPFNGDPAVLPTLVTNPDRIRVVAPGQPFRLGR